MNQGTDDMWTHHPHIINFLITKLTISIDGSQSTRAHYRQRQLNLLQELSTNYIQSSATLYERLQAYECSWNNSSGPVKPGLCFNNRKYLCPSSYIDFLKRLAGSGNCYYIRVMFKLYSTKVLDSAYILKYSYKMVQYYTMLWTVIVADFLNSSRLFYIALKQHYN